MGKFFLIDGNNFFVSCERVRNPALNNKPVLVLANNGSAVVARSNEAKNLGFKMSEPVFKIRDKIAHHSVITINGDHEYYKSISCSLMAKIKEISKQVEVASIDEAFIYVNHLNDNYLEEFAHYIIDEINNDIGIPVSIGIGKTKTLAKTANYIAKQSSKANGVYFINKDVKEGMGLRYFPIEDVWGIGKTNATKLRSQGIFTVYDFVQLNNNYVRKLFGISIARTQMELLGTVCYPITKSEASQSITSSRSMEHTTTDKSILMQEIIKHISSCCNKLKAANLLAKRFTVSISTSRFKSNYINNSLTEYIPSPTNAVSVFITIAQQLLDKLYKNNIAYKKAGVEFNNLSSAKQIQNDLFTDSAKNRKLENLDKAVNSINAKFGKDTVKLGK